MSPLLKEIAKPALYLCGFALVGTLILAGIHAATEQRIADNERAALLRQLNELIPPDSYDNQPLQDVIMVKAVDLASAAEVTVYRARKQDQPQAAVYVVTSPNGYSGSIRMLVGVKADQTLAGVRVVTHRETPGLGDKIEAAKDHWILGFAGKSLDNPQLSGWAVKRDGGLFDQFTGATITPRAVVGSVKQVLLWASNHQEKLFDAEAESISDN